MGCRFVEKFVETWLDPGGLFQQVPLVQFLGVPVTVRDEEKEDCIALYMKKISTYSFDFFPPFTCVTTSSDKRKSGYWNAPGLEDAVRHAAPSTE